MANRRGKKEINDKITELQTEIHVLTEAKNHVRHNEDYDRIEREISDKNIALEFLNWVIFK